MTEPVQVSPPSRLEWVATGSILLILAANLAYLAFATGVTVDEPGHLLSASLYWKGENSLRPGDMPPLIAIAGGWAPRLAGLRLPAADHEVWKTGHEWDIALVMMEGLSAGEIRRVFGLARLAMMVFPLGCCFLLWWWGRRLFSPWAGLLVAAAFSLAPGVLGHGALFKNDLAAAFAYLFFWYRAWSWWRNPRPREAAWLSCALLAAILAKFSLLILVPVAPAIIIARTCMPGTRRRVAAVSLSLLALIPYCGVLLAWQLDFRGVPAEEMREWRSHPRTPWWFTDAVSLLSQARVPARLLRGVVSLAQGNAGGSRVYLLGQVHENGHPAYFLVAMAVKMPLALQAVMVAGIAASLWELFRRRMRVSDVFWTVPPFLYIALASLSNLQFGLRLVLPGLVFLFLISGKALQGALALRHGYVLPVCLLAWLALRDVQVHPQYLSYFNQLAGGPDNGLAFLSDSNIDWGQDLRRLAEMVLERRIPPKVRLAYFGTDNPWAYLTDRQLELVAPPWNDDLASGTRYKPGPGYYAISANLLTGQMFSPKYTDYFAEFRSRRPAAKAGYSIWIYRVEEEAQESSSNLTQARPK